MSLVRRQTPEEIEQLRRTKTRRAVYGIALSITALLGLSTVGTIAVARKVEALEAAAYDRLQPQGIRPKGEKTDEPDNAIAMGSGGGAQSQPKPAAEAHAHEHPHDSDSWAVPLGAIGGAGMVTVLSLMALRTRVKRRDPSIDDEGYDIATTEEYGQYSWEIRNNRSNARVRALGTELTTRASNLDQQSSVLEQGVNARLMQTRVASPLNLAHIGVLNQIGGDPLTALTYSTTIDR